MSKTSDDSLLASRGSTRNFYWRGLNVKVAQIPIVKKIVGKLVLHKAASFPLHHMTLLTKI